jgi:hypothetical protein
LKNKTPLSFIYFVVHSKQSYFIEIISSNYIKNYYSNPMIWSWTSYHLILYNNFLVKVIIHPPPLFSLYNIIAFVNVIIKIKLYSSLFIYIIYFSICKSIFNGNSQNNYLKSTNLDFIYSFFYTHSNRFSILYSIFFKYCFVWKRVWIKRKRERARVKEEGKGEKENNKKNYL